MDIKLRNGILDAVDMKGFVPFSHGIKLIFYPTNAPAGAGAFNFFNHFLNPKSHPIPGTIPAPAANPEPLFF